MKLGGIRQILLRVDADNQIGMGHAVRSSGLLENLKTPFELTVLGRGRLLRKIFPGAHIKELINETTRTLRFAIEKISPDLVLVDYPLPDAHLWKALSINPDLPVVAIDDEGGEIVADLIINGTVLEEYHRYNALPAGAKVLSGGQFALIRPEFGQNPWRPSKQHAVVIVVGSGDRAHRWAIYLASGGVDIRRWGQVHMVIGDTFPEINKLANRCDESGIRLSRGCSAQEMADILCRASVALTTGGMIVYEALAVGIPLIAYPQEQNLIPEMRWFAYRDCLIDLGYNGGLDGALITTSIQKLLNDEAAAHSMSIAQRATIDGRGMIRAAEAIDRLLQ